MAKLSSIASDPKKESDGIWQTYPGTDIRVCIARLGNPKYDEQARRLRKSAKVKAAAAGESTEREAKDSIAPAVAKYIILNWENIQDDNGKTIPYSVDEAVKLLKQPELHDFYDWILERARDADAYRKELVEESLGN